MLKDIPVFRREWLTCLYVVKSFGIKDNTINTIFKETKIMKKYFALPTQIRIFAVYIEYYLFYFNL